MSTSAKTLHGLLTIVSEHPNQKEKWLNVFSNHFGYSSPTANADVILHLSKLFSRIEEDIDGMPVDGGEKRHIENFLTPFRFFKTFSHLHLDVAQARSHFLKAEHLQGLLNLHFALMGFVRSMDLPPDAKELARKFDVIQRDIIDAALPDALKRILVKRTSQMRTILDHFQVFGLEDLKDELDGLVGAIVVAKRDRSIPDKLLNKLVVLATAALGVLTVLEAGTEKVVLIANNSQELLGVIEEFQNSSDEASVDENGS